MSNLADWLKREQQLVDVARVMLKRHENPGGTHYNGCHESHPMCMVTFLADALTEAIAALRKYEDSEHLHERIAENIKLRRVIEQMQDAGQALFAEVVEERGYGMAVELSEPMDKMRTALAAADEVLK